MLSAGVPLLEALTVSADASNNRIYKAALLTSRDAILQGQGVARPIAATGLFPGSVVQMIRVGEDSGTLPTQLETAARFYERELEYKLKRFTTLFEPAVMIFVGIIVGFVALALVSAMYGIYRQVQV
jgi:type IV pilus assembly protein PilC